MSPKIKKYFQTIKDQDPKNYLLVKLYVQ